MRDIISQFMIRNVADAKSEQSISHVRHQMLKAAFSHLPIFWDGSWCLIGERATARYVRGAPTRHVREKRLATKLEDAIASKAISLSHAKTALPDTLVEDIQATMLDEPIVVVDEGNRLVGMLPASGMF
jgi:CBS-domain-containing membrane protein